MPSFEGYGNAYPTATHRDTTVSAREPLSAPLNELYHSRNIRITTNSHDDRGGLR